MSLLKEFVALLPSQGTIALDFFSLIAFFLPAVFVSYCRRRMHSGLIAGSMLTLIGVLAVALVVGIWSICGIILFESYIIYRGVVPSGAFHGTVEGCWGFGALWGGFEAGWCFRRAFSREERDVGGSSSRR